MSCEADEIYGILKLGSENMYKKWIKKFGGWFVLGLLLIATYKLFDELLVVSNWVLDIVNIVRPFLIGAVLAYLLYIPANALERQFLKSPRKWPHDHARSMGVLVTFFLFLLTIVGIVLYLIPVIRTNVTEITERLPSYSGQIEDILRQISKALDMPDLYISLELKIKSIFESLLSFQQLEPWELLNHGMGIVSTVYAWLMAIVVCPYLLMERQNLLNIFDQLMLTKINPRDLRFIHRYASKINHIFSSFIFGKAIDSLIIGIISYIAFKFMGLKFDLLLALILLVTNMIPYFGPFIGGIPVTIITVLSMGMSTGIWTAIFIIALQQFDGLILGPYILGESVGVSALWIIFSITFFGGTMGFIGMVIGVPLIAVIRMIYHDWIRYRTLCQVIQKSGALE